jgi:hypothetical protein
MKEDTIVSLFTVIERQVQELGYGTITGNVLIARGLPVPKTLNLVLSKRKRYKVSEVDRIDNEV